jgi:hypothetical protein
MSETSKEGFGRGKGAGVLYDDPIDGGPPSYARDDVPRIERCADGQTTPSPQAIDFTPGELLGSVSGELSLRKFLEERGHTLVVTSDKDGPDSVFERELPDADVRLGLRARASRRRRPTRSSSASFQTPTSDPVFERELPDADVVISQPFWPPT